jgi:hypothetical protein
VTEKKSAATLLVAIAEDLFTFGCAREEATGDPRVDNHRDVLCWVSPKGAPDKKRPLADIRPDLAAVYGATYGEVPGAHALGDAMTVLEGKCKATDPVEADGGLLALLSGKDTVATELVQLAEKHYSFGVTITGDAFAVPKLGANVARVLRGGRRSLRAELAALYYAKKRTAAHAQALADALLILEAKAQAEEPTEVALRVGQDPLDGRLVLDLGTEDGKAAIIGAYGWEIVDTSPVLMWRTNATLPLPMPDDVGNIAELRPLLNVSDDDWPLIIAYLVAALIPGIPHPVLLLRGEHGTAKSMAAWLLSSLIDPCAAQLRTAPGNSEDWAVAAAGSWVTIIDNISHLQPWLQDAICKAVTGDGLLRRALYTNADVSVLAFRRVIGLTSIDPGPLHGDLADRLLSIDLELIAEDDRLAEEALKARWAGMRPRVLGGLLHTAVLVLRELDKVRHHNLPRMADFGRVLLAVDKAYGTSGYERYREQAGDVAEHVIESDSVAVAIREQIVRPWQGTAGDLRRLLTPDRPPQDWPKTPDGMGGRVARLAPTLRSLGWTVDKATKSGKKGSRGWIIVPPSSASHMQQQAAQLSDVSDRPTAGTSDASDTAAATPFDVRLAEHDEGEEA